MNLQVIKNRVRKIFAYTLTGVLFALVSSFLFLQIPAVQQFLISRYLRGFSSVVGFNTTIGEFRMLWFDRLELKQVLVTDPVGNKMIDAKEILINFKLSHLLEHGDVNIDGVFLDGTQVLLTNIPESDTSRNLNFNIFINRINENYASTSTDTTGHKPRINIGEAFLNESVFAYKDPFRAPIQEGFNYNQFTIDIDEAQLQNFLMLGDTTEFQLRTMIAKDRKTNFSIRQLSTFFRLSQRSMEFLGVNLLAGNSFIADTVIFEFDGQQQLSDFITKVDIHANLDRTVIYPDDLALFAPEASKLHDEFTLSGIIDGRVNNFKLSNMELVSGRTTLRGSLDMDGLPDITETFIILNLKDSRLDFTDLEFALDENTLSRLKPLGRVTLDGEFLGYPSDFVANGVFTGRLGRIKSDINFKVNQENFNLSEYSGKLALSDFMLGEYLNDTINFQKVTLNGNIKGAGLTLGTADFTLNGTISSLGIRKYNYTKINTNARFASSRFNGFLQVDDPNLQFSAKGSVDLRENVNRINIEADLDTAFVHKLNLSADELFLHSKMVLHLQGLHLDSIRGTAQLQDLAVRYKGNELHLDEAAFTANRRGNERKITLFTDLLDANIEGNFLMSDITRDISMLVSEVILNINNDKTAIQRYYKEKTYTPKNYNTNISINLKKTDPLMELLGQDLHLSNPARIEGKFASGHSTILQLFTHFDTVRYQGNTFLRSDIELNASKISDSTSVLASLLVDSDHQIFSPAFQTEELVAEAIWNNNHIDFSADVDQRGQPNALRLRGGVDFLRDSTLIRFQPSSIKILDKNWSFNPANLITIFNDDVRFANVALISEDQQMSAAGIISPRPEEKLNLEITNLDLSVLNSLTGRKFSGKLDASFALANLYNEPSFENKLNISKLTIDDFLVGDVMGDNHWDTQDKKFFIDFTIDRSGNRMVTVSGTYDPREKESPLRARAMLKEANLKIVEPFIEDIFSEIGGTITGNFDITGKLAAPEINGEGLISKGKLMINYLRTAYFFEGVFGMAPGQLYFKNIVLTDLWRNNGRLNAVLYHKNFGGMTIDLDANFTGLQLLNTSARDNSLFYGQGFATGDLKITGPLQKLMITANARTDKNTRIYIPIGGFTEVEEKEFIRFVSFSDSTANKAISNAINNSLDLSGITMDFNLDVTPDAYCEIILDLQAGDIIGGRGQGKIQLQLDTKGEFNMFGPFEFTQGWYNFTLYDIFNKNFEIKKGSRITWYGDPYGATLDINASYNQLASFAPIVSNTTLSSSPQLRRKYPVEVLLKLTGQLLDLAIDFDITTRDLPQTIMVNNTPVRLDFEFQAFKSRLDEQELKRQVFSLVVLRRFSPLGESLNTSGSIANSVSELLSNQLSNFISQVDENLEIDVDLSTLDQEAYNTFQLRLSYTFLNGRLRVTRDGTFYGNNNQNNSIPVNQNSVSSIAGDWTVDYALTADGKFKVKMYNRTNVNPIFNSIGSQNSITTGVSLSHTQTFNRLRDLWRSSRKRREEEEKKNRERDDQADVNKETEQP